MALSLSQPLAPEGCGSGITIASLRVKLFPIASVSVPIPSSRFSASPPTVTLTLDGRTVTVPGGTTIWDAAQRHGIDIPVLCHSPRLRPVGVCRLCVVDVGGRVLAASCVRPCEDGMTVQTGGDRVERQRRMLTALLLADHPTLLSRVYLAHVREKTVGGAPVHADTHPFHREQGGTDYAFAHNGTLAGAAWDLPLGRHRPVGATDSERFFCHLLHELGVKVSVSKSRFEIMNRIANKDQLRLKENNI